jgi:hypothetical protein
VGTGRNKVQLKLGRGDLGAKYECRAMNDALETPMLSWINVDVHGKHTKSFIFSRSFPFNVAIFLPAWIIFHNSGRIELS